MIEYREYQERITEILTSDKELEKKFENLFEIFRSLIGSIDLFIGYTEIQGIELIKNNKLTRVNLANLFKDKKLFKMLWKRNIISVFQGYHIGKGSYSAEEYGELVFPADTGSVKGVFDKCFKNKLFTFQTNQEMLSSKVYKRFFKPQHIIDCIVLPVQIKANEQMQMQMQMQWLWLCLGTKHILTKEEIHLVETLWYIHGISRIFRRVMLSINHLDSLTNRKESDFQHQGKRNSIDVINGYNYPLYKLGEKRIITPMGDKFYIQN